MLFCGFCRFVVFLFIVIPLQQVNLISSIHDGLRSHCVTFLFTLNDQRPVQEDFFHYRFFHKLKTVKVFKVPFPGVMPMEE